MDWLEIKTMLKGWVAVALFIVAVCLFLYLGDSLRSATFAPDVDHSKEIQEAIDKVDEEMADPHPKVWRTHDYGTEEKP